MGVKVNRGRIERADEILKLLIANLKASEKDGCLDVEMYANGRENGYVVTFFAKNYAKFGPMTFSEYRNSDSTVVYEGNFQDFRDDKRYMSRAFFTPDKTADAVAYILKKMGL